MLLLTLLPLTGFFMLFLVAYSRLHAPGIINRIRLAFLYATLLGCGWCIIITEGLSYFSQINFTWILIGWCLPVIVPLIYLIRKKALAGVIQEIFSPIYKTIAGSWMIKLILVILLVCLGIAFAYPPNNFDAMTYHLARVAHWQQNESISHYQTHVLRQLNYPPFGEWMLLHLQVLTDGDQVANALQLFFFAGCIFNVTLIAREFGANARIQTLSALFTCLVPMAILQSHTAQNDIILAFFVTAFVYLTIAGFRRITNIQVFMAGLSLGLAFLTKGTGMIFTSLFCLWFIVSLFRDLRRQPFKHFLLKAAKLSCILWLALLINAGHFYRNSFLSGTYMGNASEGAVNEAFDAGGILMVGLKNFLNHMPVNKHVKYFLITKPKKFGIDADDGRFSMMPTSWMAQGFSFHEDYAQNFVHISLIILTLGAFFLKKRTYKNLNTYFLFVCTLCATVLLYCILLKWQPWANRLQLPLFFLFSVFLAFQLDKAKKWFRIASIAAMLLFALPALVKSERQPLIPFKKSRFTKSYDSFIYHPGIVKAKAYLDTRPHKKLGIYIGPDSWDYPYYRMFSKTQNGCRIIKHVFVNNQSVIYLDKFVPDAILSLESRMDQYNFHGILYYRTKVFVEGPVIFERDTTHLAGQ